MENVRICCCELPCELKGFVTKRFEDGEDYYTIYINSNIREEMQQETLKHELSHISNCDFESDSHVNEIEYLRH